MLFMATVFERQIERLFVYFSRFTEDDPHGSKSILDRMKFLMLKHWLILHTISVI